MFLKDNTTLNALITTYINILIKYNKYYSNNIIVKQRITNINDK